MTPWIYWGSGAVALLCLVTMVGMALAAIRRLRELQRTEQLPTLKAEQQARTLARSILAAHEFTQIQRHGYLDIPSTLYPTQRRYRLPLAHGMIEIWEQDHLIEYVCLIPEAPLAAFDEILALRILILADEQAFLARATHFPERPTTQVGQRASGEVRYATEHR
ncbi:MAG: hypothetical protein H0X24_00080 [Ktedonobacterales bacterium]|nr:hypothetical protein [Ktedonobacterales bacterium]